MNDEMQPILQRAAEAFLTSDRAKTHEFGGQKLNHVESVTIHEDLPVVIVTDKGGNKQEVPVLPHLVYRPKDRGTRPADVHDAVAAAITEGARELAGK